MHYMRPRKLKLVGFQPDITYFKPQGVPIKQLKQIILNVEELEALRLCDLKGFNQTQAAENMQIHQSTLQRTLTRARMKITDALVNGLSIKIEGGNYKMPLKDGTGPRGLGPRSGRGRGNCNTNTENNPDLKNNEFGLGRGMGQGQGRGLGRGQGRGFGRQVPNSNDEEKDTLKREIESLKKRIEELEK